MRNIYFDNNASTYVHDKVLEEMILSLKSEYGNPSSTHLPGKKAKEALENARAQVALLIGANPENVIFTSGGTESNNLAIGGFARQHSERCHFITSNVEHPSVLRVFRFLESQGHSVTYLPVNSNGVIFPEQIEEAITSETALISFMLSNNETGILFPIKEIGKIAKKHNILFHCDAVQGAGKIPVNVEDLMVDFLSLSAHKIHGPKGVGALFIRKLDTISPIALGGGQEKGKRSGTEPFPAIIGMGKACERTLENLKEGSLKILTLRDSLERKIIEKIPGSVINGVQALRICNTTNISFPGVDNARLLANLSQYGIFASGGSACSSNSHEHITSYVLMAMGLTKQEADSSVRFSLSIENTEEEIEQVVETLKELLDNVSISEKALTISEKQKEPDALKIFKNDLDYLQERTLGDPGICIAILDGPVDLNHTCFDGVQIESLEILAPDKLDTGLASNHGTHVASIIFGQQDGPVKGIAPGCRGLVIPIFQDRFDSGIINCTQMDLARAITRAVKEGANIINISGGQLTSGGNAENYLDRAIRLCEENNVLVIAAAGNDGCECLHVPASLSSVLAVGALDTNGLPLASSNWGEKYRDHGILAVGENILGAEPGGGTSRKTGTSFATPVVAGIAGLLLSLQVKNGSIPNPAEVRDILLKSAIPCEKDSVIECKRFLVGRINSRKAMEILDEKLKNKVNGMKLDISDKLDYITKGLNENMTNKETDIISDTASGSISQVATAETENMIAKTAIGNVLPSDCALNRGKPEIVYAIGEIGYDFGTEARRDSFTQLMSEKSNPNNPLDLLEYLSKNPAIATSIIWTLNHELTPIYAILPSGPYAHLIYEDIKTFLFNQVSEGAERASIPGVIAGKATLLNGHTIPVIIPDARGMYSWSTESLVKTFESGVQTSLTDYLDRIYYDLYNLGVTPQERALNYTATNAYQAEEVIKIALKNNLQLDSISTEHSSVCRPGSDCWDVKLTFFNPKDNNSARQVFFFTVDVSDVVPVTVGRMRTWAIY